MSTTSSRSAGLLALPALGALSILVTLSAPLTARAADPLLERDVLPVLTKHCMGCHGGLKQEGGLDLRTAAAMLKGGKSGPAVVAGKPDASEMWIAIDEDEMPKGQQKLSAAEKEVIRGWIAAGLPTFAQRQASNTAAPLKAGQQHEPIQVAAAIDTLIEQRLSAAQLNPAPLADDAEFLRRVYLHLTGRVPTAEQAAAFLDDASPDKRAKLIDTLLASPQFGEQFGRTWRDWVCPPELPSDMNGGKQPHKEARELGVWFAARFNADDPWDRVVRDLLTVHGETKNNPQAIYFGLVGQNAKATPDGSTRTVASLFMGVQLQCAQCHDDPYRDWSQQEFWSLAAFFANTNGDFKKIDEKPGEGRVTIPKSAFRNAGTNVPVGFLRGEQPPTKKAAWRPVFVDWLTAPENPFFARAFANRAWFYLFSRGIVNPVDDFRELNPPSHPRLMKLLADEFTASGYDIKHLLRCLCNSRAYQRTSLPAEGASHADAARLTDLFGRPPVRVMTADMLFESLKLAYGDPKLDLRVVAKDDGNTNGESAAVGDAYLEFHRKFAGNEEDATDYTHGIPQLLTFINHPRLLAPSAALDAYRKAEPEATADATVKWLYLATLSRQPTEEESIEAVAYVNSQEDAEKAYVDVLWVLVNRSEYIFLR